MKLIKSIDQLEGNEFALLRVDPETGTPINSSGKWLKAGEAEYLCWTSREDAEKYAKLDLVKNPLIEWNLYNSDSDLLTVFNDLEAIKNKPVKVSWLKKLFK